MTANSAIAVSPRHSLRLVAPFLGALLLLVPYAPAQQPRSGSPRRPPPASQEPNPSEPTITGPYIVAGTVTSSTSGRALPHTRLQLDDVRTRRPVLSTEADAEGRFRFPGVPAGKFSLSGSQRGYSSASYQQHEQFSTALVTGAGVPTDNLRFQLTPLALIFGHVTDEAGDPLRDANISLYRETHGSGASDVLQASGTRTDDLGSFELPNLQPGHYFLSVEATPWYAVHARQAEHRPNSAPIDPALDVAYPLTFYPGTPDSREATPITLAGGEQVPIDLHLSPVPALTLTLPSPSPNSRNHAPPRLERRIFGGSRQPVPIQMEYTQEGVLLTGLAPGDYEVVQSGPGGGRSNATFADVHLSGSSATLSANSGTAAGSIHLAVQDITGSPLPPGAQIVLRSGRGSTPVNAELSPEGHADFRDLPPGIYRPTLFANNKTYFAVRLSAGTAQQNAGDRLRTGSRRALQLAAGEALSATLTVSARLTAVDGFAKRDSGGNGGAMVVLIPLTAPQTDAAAPQSTGLATASQETGGPEKVSPDRSAIDPNPDLFRRDQTDLDGSFSLPQVIPGRYLLVAIDDGWTLDWSDPATLTPYLRDATPITVPANTSSSLHLAEPVSIQPR